MTNAEFKTATTEEQLNFLNPLIEIASQMLIAGVLKKNVVRHFTNKGLYIDAATNLMELAELKAEELSHYKFN